MPEATGRPGCHPSTLLKIYLYGYLNQIQSSRRLECECARNVELMWLTGQLKPDFKTAAVIIGRSTSEKPLNAGGSDSNRQ